MTRTQSALVDAAREAARTAYAPYSHFAVGAAILLTDGDVVTGANVENASYGLSLCAEAVALAKVANLGKFADVTELAVFAAASEPAAPCGRCRQMLNEAAQLGGRDILVHGANEDRTVMNKLSDLLPHAFGSDSLS